MNRVVIIGGGVIGLFVAWELAQAGKQCLLLEQGALGRESSWAGGGILSPVYPWRYPPAVGRLARASALQYQELAERLNQQGDGDIGLLASGMLMLDPGEAEAVVQGELACEDPYEHIGRERLRQLAPALAPGFERALWLAQIHQVRNPRLCRALANAIRRLGVVVLEHTPVEAIVQRHGRVSGVRAGGRVIAADAVVLAAGAWSARLLPESSPVAQIRPIKGQMLLLQAPPGLIRQILVSDGRYLIPRADGLVLVGSTMEDVGFDKQVDAAVRDELLAHASGVVPALAQAQIVSHWSGLRPAVAEGIPLIGTHPDLEGLFVNSGHFRNGLCTAPASARLLADLMLGRTPDTDPAPYAVAAALDSAGGEEFRYG
jgi:glycine oxidase